MSAAQKKTDLQTERRAISSSLDERDHAILHALLKHKVLTTHQLYVLFFRSLRRCQHRLSALKNLELISSFEPRRDFGQGRSPDHHFLTELGVSVLAQRDGVPRGELPWVPDESYKDNRNLRHRMGVNAFFCALVEASRLNEGHCLERWVPERKVKTGAGEIQPDGFGRYLHPGGACEFYLEYDRATEGPAALSEKLRSYLRFSAGWGEGAPFPNVLVVVPRHHREGDVAQAVHRAGRGLTEALSEKGLRNRLGNPPGMSAVHRMLRNPVYAGVVRWKGIDREGRHTPLISREFFARVQAVPDAHSTGGERSWKHDHYLKGTLLCAECESRLYYVLAKGRFGYFRCVGRNTKRRRCSQTGYVPASQLEHEIQDLYREVRIPPALERRVERALRTEIADRERHRAEAAVFLGRRLRQLANEREKLLRAYYADAIDVDTLKREQARISAEVAEVEAGLATDGEKLKQAKQLIDLALGLAKNCAASYRKARPEVQKMWNQAFFRKVLVREGRVAGHEYEEPFASLLGSHNDRIVEVRGVEPLASAVRRQRSTTELHPRACSA